MTCGKRESMQAPVMFTLPPRRAVTAGIELSQGTWVKLIPADLINIAIEILADEKTPSLEYISLPEVG